MNGLDILQKDHKRILVLVDELARSAKATEGSHDEIVSKRVQRFDELREKLRQHIKIEEHVLFPDLQGFGETKIPVDECYREHKRINELLQKIEHLTEEKHWDLWDNLCAELERRVQTYLTREEDGLFPRARLLLNDGQLENMFFEIERIRSNQSETDSLIFPADRFGVGSKRHRTGSQPSAKSAKK